MANPVLVIGSKNYSSWSLRPWLAMAANGAAFDEVVISGNDEFAFAQMRYAVVPEPTSWALMIVGVGAVGAAMRSRRRLAAA